jgi:hypothetical protein
MRNWAWHLHEGKLSNESGLLSRIKAAASETFGQEATVSTNRGFSITNVSSNR